MFANGLQIGAGDTTSERWSLALICGYGMGFPILVYISLAICANVNVIAFSRYSLIFLFLESKFSEIEIT